MVSKRNLRRGLYKEKPPQAEVPTSFTPISKKLDDKLRSAIDDMVKAMGARDALIMVIRAMEEVAGATGAEVDYEEGDQYNTHELLTATSSLESERREAPIRYGALARGYDQYDSIQLSDGRYINYLEEETSTTNFDRYFVFQTQDQFQYRVPSGRITTTSAGRTLTIEVNPPLNPGDIISVPTAPATSNLRELMERAGLLERAFTQERPVLYEPTSVGVDFAEAMDQTRIAVAEASMYTDMLGESFDEYHTATGRFRTRAPEPQALPAPQSIASTLAPSEQPTESNITSSELIARIRNILRRPRRNDDGEPI